MNNKILRRENAIIRNLDGLTINDMKLAATMHKHGVKPKTTPTENEHNRRVRRAFTVLAAIEKIPGRQWFGISINNPTIILEC
jgi:hypothetical protein